jgi:hypothetical protein
VAETSFAYSIANYFLVQPNREGKRKRKEEKEKEGEAKKKRTEINNWTVSLRDWNYAATERES